MCEQLNIGCERLLGAVWLLHHCYLFDSLLADSANGSTTRTKPQPTPTTRQCHAAQLHPTSTSVDRSASPINSSSSTSSSSQHSTHSRSTYPLDLRTPLHSAGTPHSRFSSTSTTDKQRRTQSHIIQRLVSHYTDRAHSFPILFTGAHCPTSPSLFKLLRHASLLCVSSQ